MLQIHQAKAGRASRYENLGLDLQEVFELEEFEQALLWRSQLLQSDTNDPGGFEDERAIRVTS